MGGRSQILDEAALADVEGDAESFIRMAGLDPGEPFALSDLCARTMGCRPRRVLLRDGEAVLERDGDGAWDLQVDSRVPATRARFKAAHEASHWFYEEVRRYRSPDLEARCDALAAALICPRALFLKAVSRVGHRVYTIAEAFATTQSVALLRLGEVTGRPVKLLYAGGEIQRGEPFEFPRPTPLRRSHEEGRVVHPIKIRDERDRWGLMARRGL